MNQPGSTLRSQSSALQWAELGTIQTGVPREDQTEQISDDWGHRIRGQKNAAVLVKHYHEHTALVRKTEGIK